MSINKKETEEWSEEARRNIVGFFDLLYKIDKRLKNEKQQKEKKEK